MERIELAIRAECITKLNEAIEEAKEVIDELKQI